MTETAAGIFKQNGVASQEATALQRHKAVRLLRSGRTRAAAAGALRDRVRRGRESYSFGVTGSAF